MHSRGFLLTAAAALAMTPGAARAEGKTVWLDALNVTNVVQDFGSPHLRATVDGNPLRLGSKVYEHGVGTHAGSLFEIPLDGKAAQFDAIVGVDDETKGKGSIIFRVIVDGVVRADSGLISGGGAPKSISVSLTGAKTMILQVDAATEGISFDHADWADARFTLAEGAEDLPAIRTKPITLDAAPRMRLLPANPITAIHGPRITGATPGHPFLFRISATGQEPLTYDAVSLPAGLALNPKTGVISGALKKNGVSKVALIVRGPRGAAKRTLTIVGGANKLARTPAMGWNSWNVWGTKVDQSMVENAADAMIKSGLADHGYQYVNIDDAWQGDRSASGEIQANGKFPDMKGLAENVHGKGLKIGLYSSPGSHTCGGYRGSLDHEQQDADTYAAWGFDFLKYDWCSYEQDVAKGDHSLPSLQKPYAKMGDALAKQNRDIVYSLCQYGMGDVWKWGAQTGAQSWRTTGDIFDNWGSLHSIYSVQAGHEVNAGPGRWNDPDMLVVGRVGWGNPHPSGLKPNEQILHMSMWCLLASPLMIGCDLNALDPFTLALLTNDEALEINQDPLGRPASLIHRELLSGEVWSRPLFDGTRAVGLTNPNPWAQTVAVRWSDIGLKGKQPIRDLWLHQNIAACSGGYSVEVPAHGCVLLKVGRPQAR